MPLEDLIKQSNPDNYDSSVAKHIPKYPGLSLAGHVLAKNIQVQQSVTAVRCSCRILSSHVHDCWVCT